MITVSWFSAGVSSAVATKLALDQIDRIIYQHIDDQHPDTLRFVADCEKWLGKPIEIQRSPWGSVENVCRAFKFINGVHFARCSHMLKLKMRHQWEGENGFFENFRYVWGFDKDEAHRAERRREEMPQNEHLFPLIDAGIGKDEAHAILINVGIKRPAMYELGYHNNNCIGCVKGGKGYWNKIRIDFPEVFASRSKMERDIGRSCINGTFLDELDPEAGRKEGPIVPECGVFCERITSPQRAQGEDK